jgi:hypothetical protein
LVVGNVRFATNHWQATNARAKAGWRSFASKVTLRATGERIEKIGGIPKKIDVAFSISFTWRRE